MYHFIVNPNASSGQNRHIWKQIKKLLSEEQVTYQAYFPKSRKETEELTAQLTAGAPLSGTSEESICHIIVLGGDGTLNAVLQGIRCFNRTKLSCIRIGSGNDFARDLKLGRHPVKALQKILHQPEEISMDYGEARCQSGDGKVLRRRFLISRGVGYDAAICAEANHSTLKNLLNTLHIGKLIYLLIGLKQIFTKTSAPALLQLDEQPPIRIDRMFFLTSMIHCYEGGGVPFCPNADYSDGLLDLCLVESMPKYKLLLAVLLVYFKKHYCFPEVTGYRCRSLRLQTARPEWLHMDGETPCKIQKLSIKCLPGLKVIR